MRNILLLLLIALTSFSLEAAKPKKITIYTKQSCGRCGYVKKYLKKNKIKHTELKTSKKENNAAMWKLLKEDGHKGSVMMPVVQVGKKLHYNMKDIKSFVEKLK